VYAPGKHLSKAGKMEAVRTWSYAVTAGDQIADEWPLTQFENGVYHLRVYGPNGFFREFKGNGNDPDIVIAFHNMEVSCKGDEAIEITDNAYKSGNHTVKGNAKLVLDLSKSFGWYDFTVKVKGFTNFEQRFAGRVETGKTSFSDPLMGQVKL
jgi:phospholipase C